MADPSSGIDLAQAVKRDTARMTLGQCHALISAMLLRTLQSSAPRAHFETEGAMMPIQSHEHPALTADAILFAMDEDDLSVLLIRRRRPPFEGAWAFPGGFVNVGESLREAVRRELEEETGIRGVHLEQLRAYGDPERDPRGHVVTVAYLGVVGWDALPQAEAGSDAEQVAWWPTSDPPPLAFDHAKILKDALLRLSSTLTCTPADTALLRTLPQDLSVEDVEAACSAIIHRLGKEI